MIFSLRHVGMRQYWHDYAARSRQVRAAAAGARLDVSARRRLARGGEVPDPVVAETDLPVV